MTRNKEYRDTRFRFDKYSRLFRDSRYKKRIEEIQMKSSTIDQLITFSKKVLIKYDR